jgi:hypothetical protein
MVMTIQIIVIHCNLPPAGVRSTRAVQEDIIEDINYLADSWEKKKKH